MTVICTHSIAMSHNGLHLVRPSEGADEAAPDVRPPRPRVLLVEDDAAIRESLAELLQDEGFDLLLAANGQEALEILRRGASPAAILLDLMMPVMDGWDFRQAQLEDPELRGIPVVVVSAAGFSPDTIRMQFGEVEQVPKPVHHFELLEALARACGQSANAA